MDDHRFRWTRAASHCRRAAATDDHERQRVVQDRMEAFRAAVGRLAEQWLATGLPSRQVLDQEAQRLARYRIDLDIAGLWEQPPTMLTATLDDGLGQGLTIIEKFAAAIGIHVISLGLMLTPETILAACRRHRPDYLGLTVLQFDSEEDLKTIADQLPSSTRIVAGGPVFSGDAAFAERTGTHYAARNVADFLQFMSCRGSSR